jgi:hypothetical protein
LLPQALNARVVPELAALIEQLLAAEPEARGRAREVAEAAEVAAKHAGSEADVPLTGSRRSPSRAMAAPVKVEEPQIRPWEMLLKCALAAGFSVIVVVASGWLGQFLQAQPGAFARFEKPEKSQERDGGRSSLADASVSSEVSSPEQCTAAPPETIALEMPEEPLPGQRLAPCRRGEIAIHGGCWAPWANLTPPCGNEAYEWQVACYWPLFYKPRPRTSHEPR